MEPANLAILFLFLASLGVLIFVAVACEENPGDTWRSLRRFALSLRYKVRAFIFYLFKR